MDVMIVPTQRIAVFVIRRNVVHSGLVVKRLLLVVAILEMLETCAVRQVAYSCGDRAVLLFRGEYAASVTPFAVLASRPDFIALDATLSAGKAPCSRAFRKRPLSLSRAVDHHGRDLRETQEERERGKPWKNRPL